jgi:prepilin-type N-terminal cleavage/methylation domain-containing protein/prepilin-type processing-associated H-X9-DG protein
MRTHLLKNGANCHSRKAFTLVELLVVIGIIAAFIAILLPALMRATESARRLKCLSNLRSMGQAGQMHALDHKGHMPFAGHVFPTARGFWPNPEGLNDPARLKYSYYSYGDPLLYAPLPLPAALGQYMGIAGLTRARLEELGRMEMVREMERTDLRRHFSCPSQDPESILPGYSVYWQHGFGARIYMSYIANGQFLGRFPIDTPNGRPTPAGQLSKVRRPSQVLLFVDGNPQMGSGGIYTVQSGNPEYYDTLYDHWVGPGSSFKQFDHNRHRGLMNVVFIDGHAETVVMPKINSFGHPIDGKTGDFERIGLMRGIYE